MALTKTRAREITITPTGAALGADVSDFDISEIDEAGIEAIRKAWLEHLVLRIRGQDFGDAEHTRFAKLLAPLELAPKTMFTGEPWMAEFPEMSRITNIIVDRKAVLLNARVVHEVVGITVSKGKGPIERRRRNREGPQIFEPLST